MLTDITLANRENEEQSLSCGANNANHERLKTAATDFRTEHLPSVLPGCTISMLPWLLKNKQIMLNCISNGKRISRSITLILLVLNL